MDHLKFGETNRTLKTTRALVFQVHGLSGDHMFHTISAVERVYFFQSAVRTKNFQAVETEIHVLDP